MCLCFARRMSLGLEFKVEYHCLVDVFLVVSAVHSDCAEQHSLILSCCPKSSIECRISTNSGHRSSLCLAHNAPDNTEAASENTCQLLIKSLLECKPYIYIVVANSRVVEWRKLCCWDETYKWPNIQK